MIRLSLIKFKDQLIQGVSLPLSLHFFFFLIVLKGLKKDIISGKKHESTGRQRGSEGRYHFPSCVGTGTKFPLFGLQYCLVALAASSGKKGIAVLSRRALPLLFRGAHRMRARGSQYTGEGKQPPQAAGSCLQCTFPQINWYALVPEAQHLECLRHGVSGPKFLLVSVA